MKHEPLSHDDPRLTAYALGEMTPAERAEFEPLLQQDAAARQLVEEIRATGALLAEALEHEPVEVMTPKPAEKKRGVLLRFPQLYFTVSGLAAACFAVFFVLWQNGYKEPQKRQLLEVQLADATAQAKEKKVEAARPDARGAAAENESKRREERAKGSVAFEMPVAAAAPVPSPAAPAIAAAPAADQLMALDKSQMVADGTNAPSANAMSYGPAATGKATSLAGVRSLAGADAVTGRVQGGREAGNTEAYGYHKDSDYLRVADQPLSTFAIDVDTASYANVRRFLLQGRRPPAAAVRIEELVNYFPYHYAPPAGGAPFAVALESAGAPWNPAHRLVRIGLKGRVVAEAPKTPVEQAGGTLQTIARDVKIQVEFNPAVVSAYRLIGYEDRLLAKEDFNNDQLAAGDIGAGHTVTALYEVVPVGAPLPGETTAVDALKYQKTENRGQKTTGSSEMLTVKIRYKEPAGDVSRALEFPLRDSGAAFAGASPDFKFAAAVAAFGMVLRDSPHKGTSTLANVTAWGREGLEDDAGGYRAEFLSLVERAATIQ